MMMKFVTDPGVIASTPAAAQENVKADRSEKLVRLGGGGGEESESGKAGGWGVVILVYCFC